MTRKADIPKDYQPIIRTMPKTDANLSSMGYDTDGHAEAACDGYRLHWEHNTVRLVWRELADKPVIATITYRIDKSLLAWIKAAEACANSYAWMPDYERERRKRRGEKFYPAPLRFDRDKLRVKSPDTGFGTADAAFARPLPLPDSWRAQYGIDPRFLREALEYVTRGKEQDITVVVHEHCIRFDNCTRHALVMPIKLREEQS